MEYKLEVNGKHISIYHHNDILRSMSFYSLPMVAKIHVGINRKNKPVKYIFNCENGLNTACTDINVLCEAEEITVLELVCSNSSYIYVVQSTKYSITKIEETEQLNRNDFLLTNKSKFEIPSNYILDRDNILYYSKGYVPEYEYYTNISYSMRQPICIKEDNYEPKHYFQGVSKTKLVHFSKLLDKNSIKEKPFTVFGYFSDVKNLSSFRACMDYVKTPSDVLYYIPLNALAVSYEQAESFVKLINDFLGVTNITIKLEDLKEEVIVASKCKLYKVTKIIEVRLHGESEGHNYLSAIMFRWLYWQTDFQKYIDIIFENINLPLWDILHLLSEVKCQNTWNIFNREYSRINVTKEQYLTLVNNWKTNESFSKLLYNN